MSNTQFSKKNLYDSDMASNMTCKNRNILDKSPRYFSISFMAEHLEVKFCDVIYLQD